MTLIEERLEGSFGDDCEMSVDLVIDNAKIYTEQGIYEGGIAVREGKIWTVAKSSNLPRASVTINANKMLILPGLIDVHAHLRDLDLAYKEDYYTGTCAAVSGGFTTVFDMPNTVPPTNSVERLRKKMEFASDKIVANVGFYSSLPKRIEEVKPIADLGAIGFKLFLNKPDYVLDIDNDRILVEAFKKIKKTNKILAVHAEDKAIIEDLKCELKKARNSGIEVYHKAHPLKAEIQAVKRLISLVKKSQVKIHFCHISTHEALIDIVRAKAEGWKVSCEATPHHLLLSNEDAYLFGNSSIIDPPLRDEETVKALWQGLINGDIDLIATDHAPHTLKEKRNENVWKVPPGAPGLETALPVLLNMVNKGALSLSRVVESLASTPARVFGLKGKGLIKEGFDADLTMVDLKKEFKIDPSNFHSKAKYSPFSGLTVLGSVLKTFIGGMMVMEDSEVLVNPGAGNILRLE